MVRKLCLCALLLAALLVVASGAQTQTGTLSRQPQGELFQRADGSYGYIVSSDDRVGQWQVAFGSPQLWLELVEANPQLVDPDLIMPGEELNVPTSLVRLFNIMKAANEASGPQPVPTGSMPPVEPKAPEKIEQGSFPWWGYALIAIMALLTILFILILLRSNRRADEAVQRAENVISESIRQDEQRHRTDPYSGPPVRENGLPTVEAAEAFFAETYRSQREAMTVVASNAQPATVHIERIVPVDVRGPMMVQYADGPQMRNIRDWTPAWQCFFSDGSFRITLMRCANDVWGGYGIQAIPATQIRPRQDIPVRESDRQVWPVVSETPASVEHLTEVPDQVVEYTSARITSPTRYVLHRTGDRETVIDLGVLANAITLGIEGETVYAIIGGQRRVIGRIVEPAAETAATPTGDGTPKPAVAASEGPSV